MAHSQTPWPMPIYDNHGNGGFSEWWEISGIARVYSQEDAEFILRAVNCHDELVAVLKAFLAVSHFHAADKPRTSHHRQSGACVDGL